MDLKIPSIKLTKKEKAELREKELARLDKIIKGNVEQIIKSYLCHRANYGKGAMPCIDVNGVHVKVNNEQLQTWSKNINKNKASYDVPHRHLINNLRE